MNMKEFLVKHEKSPDKIQILADEVGTKVVYLKQIATGFRKPGAKLTLKLHRATNGEVHVSHIRPDIYPSFIFDCFHEFKLSA